MATGPYADLIRYFFGGGVGAMVISGLVYFGRKMWRTDQTAQVDTTANITSIGRQREEIDGYRSENRLIRTELDACQTSKNEAYKENYRLFNDNAKLRAALSQLDPKNPALDETKNASSP